MKTSQFLSTVKNGAVKAVRGVFGATHLSLYFTDKAVCSMKKGVAMTEAKFVNKVYKEEDVKDIYQERVKKTKQSYDNTQLIMKGISHDIANTFKKRKRYESDIIPVMNDPATVVIETAQHGDIK